MDKIIEFKNVTKEYPGSLALKGISFSVAKSGVHGFLGPNGAGKSTTLNILTGLIPPSSGEVRVNNLNILQYPMETRAMIGFLPEHPPLYESMRVEDYLKFVSDIHVFRDKTKWRDLRTLQKRIIERTGLEKVKKKVIGALSKGYRQRVGMAQALIFDPEIILFDEPTNGLDPDSIIEIRKLIKDLSIDKTILFSSHLLSEVEILCNDITIINKGEISFSGPLAGLTQTIDRSLHLSIQAYSWSDQKEKELSHIFDLSEVQVKKEGDLFDVSFYLKMPQSPQNLKSFKISFAKKLVESNIDLISLNWKNLPLEKAFLKLTAKDLEKKP